MGIAHGILKTLNKGHRGVFKVYYLFSLKYLSCLHRATYRSFSTKAKGKKKESGIYSMGNEKGLSPDVAFKTLHDIKSIFLCQNISLQKIIHHSSFLLRCCGLGRSSAVYDSLKNSLKKHIYQREQWILSTGAIPRECIIACCLQRCNDLLLTQQLVAVSTESIFNGKTK